MNRIFHLILAGVLLFTCASYTHAGALENGLQAFKQGDYQRAMARWQLLAEKNDPDALYNIALLYMKGLGVAQDDVTAKKWFLRAAQYGSVDAAYNLGVFYKRGRGGYPSNKDALYWWKQAAEYGHAESQYNLGVMLAYGWGTKKDEKTAVAWWKKAAAQAHKEAVELLIQAYEQGLFGMPLNPAKATAWRKHLSSLR